MKLKIRTALAVIAMAAGTLTISACNDNTLEEVIVYTGEGSNESGYGGNGDTLRAEEQPIPEVIEEI